MIIQQWTGREAKMLRLAMRMSIDTFADHLGLSSRAINKWEARGPTLTPRHDMQAILDTALAQTTQEQRERFNACLPTVHDAEGGLELDTLALVKTMADVDHDEAASIARQADSLIELERTLHIEIDEDGRGNSSTAIRSSISAPSPSLGWRGKRGSNIRSHRSRSNRSPSAIREQSFSGFMRRRPSPSLPARCRQLFNLGAPPLCSTSSLEDSSSMNSTGGRPSHDTCAISKSGLTIVEPDGCAIAGRPKSIRTDLRTPRMNSCHGTTRKTISRSPLPATACAPTRP